MDLKDTITKQLSATVKRKGTQDYMTDEERMKAGCWQGAALTATTIVTLLLCALLAGCTTTRYVPVTEIHTDTLMQTRTQHDSIYVSDSIYISDFVRTDTVFRTIDRWHTKFRDRWHTDTLRVSHTDTVQIAVPVPDSGQKESKPSLWYRARIHLANLVLLLLFAALIVWAIRRAV